MFTDLIAWKESHKLVLKIYQLTNKFPSEERFGLTSQFQRAGVSITGNIAEGFGRITFKDQTHFYSIAIASLKEVQNYLILAKDLHYITTDEHQDMLQQSNKASQILNGLIRKSREKIASSSLRAVSRRAV